jgi:hypothetical protein
MRDGAVPLRDRTGRLVPTYSTVRAKKAKMMRLDERWGSTSPGLVPTYSRSKEGQDDEVR